MPSLYKGNRKFDREQLIFLAQVAINSTLSMIDGWLPPNVSKEEYDSRGKEVNAAHGAAVELLGWNLSILYAQLTDDGLGVGDALEIAGLRTNVEKWIQWSYEAGPDRYQQGNDYIGDTRPWATAWVDSAFDEYLAELASGLNEQGPFFLTADGYRLERKPVWTDGDLTFRDGGGWPVDEMGQPLEGTLSSIPFN